MNPPLPSLPRREFLKTSAARLAAVVAVGPSPLVSILQAVEPTSARMSIGIQVGAVSFVDEGTEKVLDLLQERGGVDTIYLTTFTYGRGLAGRQIPGQPFPDHGQQESDEKTFHGGNYATPHPEFYRDTVAQADPGPRSWRPRHCRATVLPAAKKRGMRVLCSIEDVFRGDVPGVKEVAEVDLQGRKTGTLCLCHPERARVLDRPGHGPLHVVRHRRNPVLQRTQRAVAQRAGGQPRPEHCLIPCHLLLRASPARGEGTRHRLRPRPSRATGNSTNSCRRR